MLTGESMPVSKEVKTLELDDESFKKNQVYMGCIATSGTVVL